MLILYRSAPERFSHGSPAYSDHHRRQPTKTQLALRRVVQRHRTLEIERVRACASAGRCDPPGTHRSGNGRNRHRVRRRATTLDALHVFSAPASGHRLRAAKAEGDAPGQVHAGRAARGWTDRAGYAPDAAGLSFFARAHAPANQDDFARAFNLGRRHGGRVLRRRTHACAGVCRGAQRGDSRARGRGLRNGAAS
jgi:hypothetical protein